MKSLLVSLGLLLSGFLLYSLSLSLKGRIFAEIALAELGSFAFIITCVRLLKKSDWVDRYTKGAKETERFYR